jgi:hypothetical protein
VGQLPVEREAAAVITRIHVACAGPRDNSARARRGRARGGGAPKISATLKSCWACSSRCIICVWPKLMSAAIVLRREAYSL